MFCRLIQIIQKVRGMETGDILKTSKKYNKMFKVFQRTRVSVGGGKETLRETNQRLKWWNMFSYFFLNHVPQCKYKSEEGSRSNINQMDY